MKNNKSSVGKIYLYLFSMLGLILIVIGAVGLINVGLRLYVFDASDPWGAQPPMPRGVINIEELEGRDELSEEELSLIREWLDDYSNWSESLQENVQRQRYHESLARNIALLFVGIPLFLFHWRLAMRKD